MKSAKRVIVVASVALAMGWQPAGGQQAAEELRGVVVGNMDPAVKPGDDFFRYCNGGVAETDGDSGGPRKCGSVPDPAGQERPACERTGGRCGESKRRSGNKHAEDCRPFHSYMDEAGIEAKGVSPLEPHLKAIAGIQDKKALAFALGKNVARRCGRTEQHKFSHRESVRALGRSGLQRFGTLHRVSDAGRAAVA